MSDLATEDICPVSAANICAVSTADICPVSTADICPVSTEDIYPVSTADMKSWPAEAATAADQINDRESLAAEAAIAANYYWRQRGGSKESSPP